MIKHLALAAFSVGLIACGGTETTVEAEQTAGKQVISVSELLASAPAGQVVIDLRNTTHGFRVEPGVDHSAINVICPSNREMNLEKWLPELAAEFQTSPAALEKGFTMYPFMAPKKGGVTAMAAPVCVDADGNHCYTHREPDGSWVCFC
jgi:hypothetical protein